MSSVNPCYQDHEELATPVEILEKIRELNQEEVLEAQKQNEAELKALSEVARDIVTFKLQVLPDASAVERKILFDELHFNRGDRSDYLIRSTQPRVKYKNEKFPAWNTPYLEPGDVVIESSLYPRYAGELQIVRQKMPNSGRSNVVAKIIPEERFMIEMIKSWQKFRFE